MRVVWKPDEGNSDVVLGDDNGVPNFTSLFVLDCYPQHSQEVQVDPVSGADAPFIKARQNLQVQYLLQVAAQFDALWKRYAWQDNLMNAVAGMGRLLLMYENGSVHQLNDAVCRAVNVTERVGTSAVAEYHFVGSSLTAPA